MPAMFESPVRLDGRTAIVTGATTGIGLETARDLYRRGARVVITARDVARGEAAAADIAGGESSSGSVEVLPLDLASLASVRGFAEAVLARCERIHLLVNNAGVMACPRAATADGFELQLGTNHLGHFLLTHLLLDRLRASAPARVVTLSSSAHRAGKIQFADLQLTRGYGKWKAYCQSKLANVLFTRELARRLAGSGVTAYAVHPGVVRTELWRHQAGCLRRLFSPVSLTPVQGAQTTLYCAVEPRLADVSGRYYAACREAACSRRARDDADAARLWAVSEQLVGVAPEATTESGLPAGVVDTARGPRTAGRDRAVPL